MRAFIAATAALLLSSAAHAVPYLEVGDAGQTLATAQTTGAGTDSISGTLTDQDADLFKIYISDFSTFSAVASSPSNVLDTELFLFDLSGHAIAANDDSSGSSFQAALPVGNALYASLTAGYYYLGISESGNEPVNDASVGGPNQLLFATGAGTAVRGPASGLSDTTLDTFDSNSYADDEGAYTITLTGVTTGPAGAVPEPAAWAMLIVGLGLIGGTLRRRARTSRLRVA